MPWHKVHDHSECPSDRPWAVVKDADGEVEGCHASEADADRQLAALYATEPDQELDELATDLARAAVNATNTFAKPSRGTPADRRLKRNKAKSPRTDYQMVQPDDEGNCPEGHHMMPGGEMCMPDDEMSLASMVGPFQGWHGPLTLEGRETGDGREFAPESLFWSAPPLPLSWQESSEPQHNRSVVVGRIDKLERRGAEILGWGVIDLGSEAGREVARQMANDMAGGVSVDVDSVKDADVELVFPDDPGEEDVAASDDILMLFGPPPDKVVFHKGRIRGATLVALPAFVEAKLRLLTDEETNEMLASLEALANGEQADLPEPASALAAAGGPLYPPTRWFQDPQHDGPTPWTVDQEGRVWGHLALWSSCHTTFADRCITPPRERDFPYFMRREIETDSGELVGVGQITMGTGHAALGLGSRPAAAHYDNTGLAMVDCAVGVDKWGIWVAGALRPSVEGVKLRELRAASLSGDWRRIGGKLRLVAILAVNVPGFPVPRTRARFTAEQPTSLVAAGVVTEERVSRYKLPRVETRSDGAVVLRRSRLLTKEV